MSAFRIYWPKFYHESPFVDVSFLLTSLQKDYFLRRRLQRYRLFRAEMLVLGITLPACSRISTRNRFVYGSWIRFQQFYADIYFYLYATVENVSIASKAVVAYNGSTP